MTLCSPVSVLTSVGAEHQTAGLPGYPAHDWFAPAHSPVISPCDGLVAKLSGHAPELGPIAGPHGPFGWSIYITSTNGRSYYLTHLETRRVRLHDRVKQGQVIGTVADWARYGTPCHVHMGATPPAPAREV